MHFSCEYPVNYEISSDQKLVREDPCEKEFTFGTREENDFYQGKSDHLDIVETTVTAKGVKTYLVDFHDDTGGQWIGFMDDSFIGRTIKVSFSVKFAQKPESSATCGIRFGGVSFFNDWIDEAVVGEWSRYEIKHTIGTENGIDWKNHYVVMAFHLQQAKLRFKKFTICLIKD